MAQRYLILDYETKSEADLKRVGAWEYARHPSTRLMCVAWRVGTKETISTAPVRKWSPFFPDRFDSLDDLLKLMCDSTILLGAHNAFFEQVITRFVLVKYVKNIFRRAMLAKLPVKRWFCTASFAAALALPRDLNGACRALKLPFQKDMEGNRLVKKYMKPRKPTKNNPRRWHNKASELLRIIDYCAQDIRAQTALFLAIPPLTPMERRVWELDQRTNWRGIRVDRPTVSLILKMIKIEVLRLTKRTREITKGELESTNKVKATKNWLEKHGLFLPNMQKKTVEDALSDLEMSKVAREILEIRQATSKSSTAKYVGFWLRSITDSIVRDILMYHGASTGRFTGVGLQVHNFPRGTVKDTWEAVDLIRFADLEFLRMIYGNAMGLFSSCLRSMIVPHPGYTFFGGDFSSIEVRVLFWLANHKAGLQAYRDKRDLYIEMAAVIYNINAKELAKRYEARDPEAQAMREVAKRAILGCGYGMGWKKFGDTCKQFGQAVTTKLAKRAVDAYRKTHNQIPDLWYNIEQAAISAVRHRGKKFTVNHTSWFIKNNILWCELPSGRRLAYYGPELKMKPTPWGEKRPTLYHWDVHPKTKQWVFTGTYGGKLVENLCQAIARDLMVESSLRVEEKGYIISLTVHDELLTEHKKGNLDHFRSLMAATPKWGREIPVEVKAWTGPRYGKVDGT